MIKAKESTMDKVLETRCSKCGDKNFKVDEHDDRNVSFVYCTKCGTALFCRDHFLMEKLDTIIDALPEMKP